ncbi:hypothetical protein NGRA_1841 [Nosema granulosis]|uniref:Uncharacterized protein n=1 Tax=Nosema granulosis TaxID=83296 RepID=A0A9P6KYS1_9MICR|nr:hypothetical protein NGRA_1841 [Nosema granulosis]
MPPYLSPILKKENTENIKPDVTSQRFNTQKLNEFDDTTLDPYRGYISYATSEGSLEPKKCSTDFYDSCRTSKNNDEIVIDDFFVPIYELNKFLIEEFRCFNNKLASLFGIENLSDKKNIIFFLKDKSKNCILNQHFHEFKRRLEYYQTNYASSVSPIKYTESFHNIVNVLRVLLEDMSMIKNCSVSNLQFLYKEKYSLDEQTSYLSKKDLSKIIEDEIQCFLYNLKSSIEDFPIDKDFNHLIPIKQEIIKNIKGVIKNDLVFTCQAPATIKPTELSETVKSTELPTKLPSITPKENSFTDGSQRDSMEYYMNSEEWADFYEDDDNIYSGNGVDSGEELSLIDRVGEGSGQIYFENDFDLKEDVELIQDMQSGRNFVNGTEVESVSTPKDLNYILIFGIVIGVVLFVNIPLVIGIIWGKIYKMKKDSKKTIYDAVNTEVN